MSSHIEPRGKDPTAPIAEMRVDQPHALKPALGGASGARNVPAPVGVAAAPAAFDASAVSAKVEHSLEQLREHAAQLADRLQSEQTLLDRRERTIAAQEADLEAKWGNARQWMSERQLDI